MAAANKPTAVHFALVFFVMAALILTVTTYLGFKKNSEKEALIGAKEKELSDQKTEVSKFRTDTDALKQVIGSNLTEIGGDAGNANTVTGDVAAQISSQGGAQAGTDMFTTLTNLRSALDNMMAENAALQLALNENKSQLTALETGTNQREDTFRQSQESSEQQLQGNIAARQQAIDEKNAEINDLKKQYNEANVLRGQVQDQLDRYRRETEERITLLEQRIDFYKDQIDELTKQGFEREDGQIVSIDNTTRTVWINIGTAESLKEQITFSVYTSDHRGIGRGVEDIKAKIEVTRVLEPHLAEARILDEDLFRPIADGDPIFSPLWAAGRTEHFAIVGRPDLDEDGRSDHELFEQLVKTAGAKLELYVNEDAERVPADGKLSARIKFLIIGDIDDPAKFSGIPERQELAERVLQQQDALIDEARLYGIRVVRLNDFLDYIGWKPEQRLWQPGKNRPFNLRQGSPATAVDEAYQDRTSDGQVSEIFRRNRTGLQQESGGTTSGLFKN